MTKAPGTDRSIDRAELIARIRLIRSPTIGPITFRDLLMRFGSAGQAVAALPGLTAKAGRRITLEGTAEAEGELRALEAMGVELLAIDSENYPPWLKHVEDAPPLLSAIGQVDCLRRPAVAIVGSRNASAAGRKMAMTIAAGLSEEGYLVVSGLARGIDAAAHEASIGNGTVAVMAGGLDQVYPPENDPLARRIRETGALISEMPLGWEPRARDFPRRNRIVSGMALAVVVVEAADRSGSLITARLAGEQGRVVCAVPGSPLDPRAAGTNRLIKNGAHLVETAEDVVNVIAPMLGDRTRLRVDAGVSERAPAYADRDDGLADTGQRERVLTVLGPAPTMIDDVIRSSGVPASVVHLVLLELDLAGRLERHGGGRVSVL
ncbi:MAG: DNA-processing protein DprA [Bauldia sp.]